MIYTATEISKFVVGLNQNILLVNRLVDQS